MVTMCASVCTVNKIWVKLASNSLNRHVLTITCNAFYSKHWCFKVKHEGVLDETLQF